MASRKKALEKKRGNVSKALDSVHLICHDCAADKHAALDPSMPRQRCHTPKDHGKVAEELVSRVYEDVLQDLCVVFVGSGCTTEGQRGQHSSNFYDAIRFKSGYSEKKPPPSFPELMEYFCERLDGGRHYRLIREAVSRIERFAVPGEENYFATMFGEELAEIPYFSRFVTTNWDPFLERSLEVLIPMVEDRDLAFWDDGRRQVLKIHGCITRPYSIVATKTDYDNCISRSPLIFNKLKDQMATKTFILWGTVFATRTFKRSGTA